MDVLHTRSVTQCYEEATMKLNSDDVSKAFKGLAIAAARAKQLVKEHGKEKLLSDLPRRQRDTIRPQLLDIESDMQTVLDIMTGK